MKRLRLLHVVFDTTIEAHEIAAFRGAIVEKVGREHIIFHNHLSNTEFVNNYPLIQYKRVGRKPSVFCLEQGVDEMYRFFVNKEWNMMMAGRELNMKVSSLNLKDYTLRVTPDIMKFRISNWLALNNENYEQFDRLMGLSEKIEKLETILIGNILSFAKGIHWTIDQQINLKLSQLSAPKILKYKGVGLTGFDAQFSVNMFLPNYLGLGKGVSHGFGTIKQI
ncbi:MAG: CRISPR-associated endonuclease Cas6 [Lentimicrobiaceae bacterium]|nr:CRISPR-associated endonuclease Cas6 [Lentimicrobiaceae bacterium]